MTKAVPPRRWLLEKRDGNQEDAHAPGPGARPSKARLPLQQQHSPDWDEDAEPTDTRDARRPTSLEELLDLELDLVLPVTAVSAPMSNQAPACAAKEDETVTDTVSLELLVRTGHLCIERSRIAHVCLLPCVATMCRPYRAPTARTSSGKARRTSKMPFEADQNTPHDTGRRRCQLPGSPCH